jgi:hypothetical protein
VDVNISWVIAGADNGHVGQGLPWDDILPNSILAVPTIISVRDLEGQPGELLLALYKDSREKVFHG